MHQWQGHHTSIFWASPSDAHIHDTVNHNAPYMNINHYIAHLSESRSCSTSNRGPWDYAYSSAQLTHTVNFCFSFLTPAQTLSLIFNDLLRACQGTARSWLHTRQNFRSWLNLLIHTRDSTCTKWHYEPFLTMQFALFRNVDYKPSNEAQYSQITTQLAMTTRLRRGGLIDSQAHSADRSHKPKTIRFQNLNVELFRLLF